MILRFLIVLLVSIWGHQGNCQLNTLDQDYINSETENLEKLLKKGKPRPGYIINSSGDTLFTFLLEFRNAKSQYSNLFCVEVLESDSVIIYYPKEVVEYNVNGRKFLRHKSNGSGFFIEEIESGEIVLLHRSPIPSDKRELYYLLFDKMKDYYVIDASVEDFEMYTIPTSNGNSSSSGQSGVSTIGYTTKGHNDKFKVFVSNYFYRCERVVNLVRNDMYGFTELRSIVRLYNKCLTDDK